MRKLVVVLFMIQFLCGNSLAAISSLTSGWYEADPFQYLDTTKGYPIVTGLDVELLKAIAQEAGYTIELKERSWERQIEAIREGGQSVAAGATYTEERAQFAYFSDPYRLETNNFYMRPDLINQLKADHVEELLGLIKEKGLRIAVIDGFVYAHPAINEFINNPENQQNVIRVENTYLQYEQIYRNFAHLFVADEIVASTIAWRKGLSNLCKPHPVSVSVPIHLMFNKRNVSPSVVDSFNKAITSIKSTGKFYQIIETYLFPVLVLQTIDARWFFMIDVLGTLAFAISGVLLAYRERYAISGAMLLSALPAVGGGVMRDLITNRNPIGVISSPIYLYLVVGVVVVGYGMIKARPLLLLALRGRKRVHIVRSIVGLTNHGISVFDAMGLAAFTITGVVVALSTNCKPLWLWGPILAAITSSGGGILREIVRSDANIVVLKGELYPEIAAFWGFFLCFFLRVQSERIDVNIIFTGVMITLFGAFITRLIAMRRGWKSLIYR